MIYIFPVTAIHAGGDTRILNNVDEMLDFARKRQVGTEWNSSVNEYGECIIASCNEWILRDDAGRPVNYRDLLPPRKDYKKRRKAHTYRSGPVPGIWHTRAGWKQDAPRKRHGGRGVLARAEMHRREFLLDYCNQRIGRHVYFD